MPSCCDMRNLTGSNCDNTLSSLDNLVSILCAIWFWGKTKLYLHFLFFFDIQITQTVEILPQGKLWLINLTLLIPRHLSRVTHICVGNLTVIGSDNGLSPGRRQAIIWTNAGILLFGPLETNIGWILIEIHTFSFKEMHLKISSGKWQPFCLGLNVWIPGY